MQYFSKFSSNTTAGSSNQKFFGNNDFEIGRVFYKITSGGMFEYSFLYSNIIDSTFSDGMESYANKICEEWEIAHIKVSICDKNFFEKDVNIESIKKWQTVKIKSCTKKRVAPGEFFCTDPILLDVKKDEYICIEIKFKGKEIPCHEELIIPAYKEIDGKWTESVFIPIPGMVGCNRSVLKRIAFLGDSITQGIGTLNNSYSHWNSLIAEFLGDKYAFWNLGIGFGRASDIASFGAWFYKSIQNDIIVICYGVNDILQGRTDEDIKSDLTSVVQRIKKEGIKVLIQTIPPFDYNEMQRTTWENVNNYILDELKNIADATFDIVPYLMDSVKNPHVAKFGGHPDKEGCKVWANALYPELNRLLSIER